MHSFPYFVEGLFEDLLDDFVWAHEPIVVDPYQQIDVTVEPKFVAFEGRVGVEQSFSDRHYWTDVEKLVPMETHSAFAVYSLLREE